MLYMLLVDAAVIGLIIAIMEQEGFPGWAPMIGSALLIGLASSGAQSYLEGFPGAVAGFLAGVLTGTMILSWACDMSLGRAAIATVIFVAIRFTILFAFQFMEVSAD